MSEKSDSQNDDENYVVFVSAGAATAPGSAELHKEKEIRRTLKQVKDDWKHTMSDLTDMIRETSMDFETQSSVKIETIEVGLAFNAKGKLGFIAEAGAEATVKLTLTRK